MTPTDIRRTIKRLGMTQTAAAEAMCLHRVYLARVLSGAQPVTANIEQALAALVAVKGGGPRVEGQGSRVEP